MRRSNFMRKVLFAGCLMIVPLSTASQSQESESHAKKSHRAPPQPGPWKVRRRALRPVMPDRRVGQAELADRK